MYWKFERLFLKVFGIEPMYNNDPHPVPLLAFMFIIGWVIIRLSHGINVANDPAHCRVKSIGDVIIAPMYTLGCNIGKDRFDIKVN